MAVFFSSDAPGGRGGVTYRLANEGRIFLENDKVRQKLLSTSVFCLVFPFGCRFLAFVKQGSKPTLDDVHLEVLVKKNLSNVVLCTFIEADFP